MDAMEAVALFDYTGRNNEELSFKKNELLSISKKLTPEWWLGQAVDGHQSGFIPDGYITFQRRLVTRQRQQCDNCTRHERDLLTTFIGLELIHLLMMPFIMLSLIRTVEGRHSSGIHFGL